jgi:hypothetical protein
MTTKKQIYKKKLKIEQIYKRGIPRFELSNTFIQLLTYDNYIIKFIFKN